MNWADGAIWLIVDCPTFHVQGFIKKTDTTKSAQYLDCIRAVTLVLRAYVNFNTFSKTAEKQRHGLG